MRIAFPTVLMIGAIVLAGCNSNSIGLNALVDPTGPPWTAYVIGFGTGVVVTVVGFLSWVKWGTR
jgi:hypothetical protein